MNTKYVEFVKEELETVDLTDELFPPSDYSVKLDRLTKLDEELVLKQVYEFSVENSDDEEEDEEDEEDRKNDGIQQESGSDDDDQNNEEELALEEQEVLKVALRP